MAYTKQSIVIIYPNKEITLIQVHNEQSVSNLHYKWTYHQSLGIHNAAIYHNIILRSA